MRRMTEKLHDGRVSLVDGIKVFLDKGEWALVLPDAEEPLFHVYAEAGDDDRAAELADKYQEIARQVIVEGRRTGSEPPRGSRGRPLRLRCSWR